MPSDVNDDADGASDADVDGTTAVPLAIVETDTLVYLFLFQQSHFVNANSFL